MDKYGIWAAVLYPNVAGFGAGKMLTMGDSELMLACVRAYNDFLAEYSSIAPDRFVPIMALPFWDLDETEKEIKRSVDLGHKGVIMTGEPFFWGMPKLADPHWDRLWAMTQEAGLSVNFHIGSGDMSIFERAYEGAGEHANYAGFGVQFGIGNVSVIANLITGGVCHRFPEQKFVSVESGVGWIPFALHHLDWQWQNCGVPQEHPEYDLLPERVLQAPDVRLLLVRERHRQGRHRADGPGLLPLRERLPAPDEHGARTGDGGRRAPPVHRRGARRPPRGHPPGRPPRQRGQALPPRLRPACESDEPPRVEDDRNQWPVAVTGEWFTRLRHRVHRRKTLTWSDVGAADSVAMFRRAKLSPTIRPRCSPLQHATSRCSSRPSQ